ncbi:MAG: competence protein ComEA [Glaciecola sp.]|jgi:competence protein ComEA
MKSWNILLKAVLISVVFAFTSVHANETSNPLLNINNASIEQLEKIKGIGAKKAQAIIDYRLQNGSFATIEDLSKVKGIGAKFIDKNKAWISVQ